MLSDRIRSWIINIGASTLRHLEGLVASRSMIGDHNFFPIETFPWAREVGSHWREMRAELDVVLQRPQDIPAFQQVSRDQGRLTNDDDWKTFFLYAYGFRATRNCDLCPATARLVESIPGMTTAFFSILAPGKHIPAHRGVFKGLVRYHLALLVPEPRGLCRIRVGDEVRSWEEGDALFFDDTYQHEVWNDTNGTRAVLFVDFVRPLRFPANLLNGLILWVIKHSPFVKDGVANYEAWEAKLDHVA